MTKFLRFILLFCTQLNFITYAQDTVVSITLNIPYYPYSCSNKGCFNNYTDQGITPTILEINKGEMAEVSVAMQALFASSTGSNKVNNKHCNNLNFNQCNYVAGKNYTLTRNYISNTRDMKYYKSLFEPFPKTINISLQRYFEKNPGRQAEYDKAYEDYQKKLKEKSNLDKAYSKFWSIMNTSNRERFFLANDFLLRLKNNDSLSNKDFNNLQNEISHNAINYLDKYAEFLAEKDNPFFLKLFHFVEDENKSRAGQNEDGTIEIVLTKDDTLKLNNAVNRYNRWKEIAENINNGNVKIIAKETVSSQSGQTVYNIEITAINGIHIIDSNNTLNSLGKDYLAHVLFQYGYSMQDILIEKYKRVKSNDEKDYVEFLLKKRVFNNRW